MFGWLGRLLGGRGRDPSPGPDDRLGPRSEQFARAFLERAGFRILAANYRCPMGELDIVAEGDGRVVFIEVKSRRLSGEPAGPVGAFRPERAVTRGKQRKIGHAARYFCRATRRTDCPIRFDVIAIDWPADGGEPTIRHHAAAFRPDTRA